MTKYLVIQTREFGPKFIPMKWSKLFGVWEFKFPGGTEIIGVTFRGDI